MLRYPVRLRVFLATIAVLAFGCGRAQDTEMPVATPSVTLAQNDAAIGTPLEMAYRFVVAPNAPAFADDYWVFVHFLDTDGELMWTDDHPASSADASVEAGADD